MRSSRTLASLLLAAATVVLSVAPSNAAKAGRGDRDAVEITEGESIQKAIDSHPAGTTFSLSGTFQVSSTIRPKSGNRFVGPARIVGAGADFGFQVAPATDVRFVRLKVSRFALQGIQCWDGTTVIGGRYHHNLRTGIGCGPEGGDVLIDGVEIDHNGSQAWLGISASGMKFAQAQGVVVRNSNIHHNLGNGVWCDQQCGNFRVIKNRIIGNSRKGVHYEKSGESDTGGVFFVGSAYIARNKIKGNAWEGRQDSDAGIAAVSSKNVVIENNILGNNEFANGIKILQDDRLNGDYHGWIVSNIVIGANVMNGDEIDGCALDGVTCS